MSEREIQYQVERFTSALNLSETEVKIYLAMLSKESFLPSEIARSTRLSRPTVYQVLRKLEEMGFCYQTIGKSALYKAILPSAATKSILAQKESQLQEAQKFVNQLDGIYNSTHNGDQGGLIDIVRYPSVFIDHHKRLSQWVKKEVIGFIPGPFDPDLVWENQTEIEAIGRGVTHRMIYEVTADTAPKVIEGMKYFAGKGEIVRLHPSLPMMMLVFDRSKTFAHFRDLKSGISGPPGFVIEHPDFGRAMARLFETYWDEAIDLDDYPGEKTVRRQRSKTPK